MNLDTAREIFRAAVNIAVMVGATAAAYALGRATEGTWFNLIFFR